MNEELDLNDMLEVETKEQPRKTKNSVIRKFKSAITGEEIILEMDEKGNVIRQL